MSMKKQAVAYYRVSTDKQGQSGLGLEAQRESVLRYCESHGLTLVAEYQDVESGKKTDRPGLRAAIAECREIGALLVIAKLDRLSRSLRQLVELLDSDVEFVAVDMPEANRLTLHIIGAIAEHESRVISERTKAAMAAAKRRGKKFGNPRAHEQKLQRAKWREEYLRKIMPMICALRGQGYSMPQIAQHLNRAGIKKDLRIFRSEEWTADSVKKVIEKIYRLWPEQAKEIERENVYKRVRNRFREDFGKNPVKRMESRPSTREEALAQKLERASYRVSRGWQDLD